MKYKPISRQLAEKRGYLIDDNGPGRPYAFKGSNHEGFSILTDLEVELLGHLRDVAFEADSVLNYMESSEEGQEHSRDLRQLTNEATEFLMTRFYAK